MLLLPALFWYNLRFSAASAPLSTAEIEVALVYVALWGWLLPLSITAVYCLFTHPRTTTASLPVPRQRRTTRLNEATAQKVPRRQSGVPVPYVYSEEVPWGWLEYRGGNFKGQRLALTRAIVSIGRDEENDIWLDDDLASRYHAELAWDNGIVYITDCDSMNGVLLNGKRIRSSAAIEQGYLLEIGSHRFLFEKALQPTGSSEQDDPLLHHVWRSANSDSYVATRPLEEGDRDSATRFDADPTHNPSTQSPLPPLPMPGETPPAVFQDTAALDQVTPRPNHPQPTETSGAFIMRDGPLIGQSFLLDRPVISIGRGIECSIVINDSSISRCHVQVLRQANGNYVQDLDSRNGTTVNNEPLLAPRLLQPGDIVCFGNIHLEYTPVQTALTTPLPMIITPQPLPRLMSGPMPLRLPSRPKNG